MKGVRPEVGSRSLLALDVAGRVSGLANMPRTMRVEYPGAIYHVTDRGYRREDIFQSDDDRRLFLETLGQALDKPVERGWDLGGEEVAGEKTLF